MRSKAFSTSKVGLAYIDHSAISLLKKIHIILLCSELGCVQGIKNHPQNVAEKLVPDPFLEIKIEHISGTRV